MSTIVIVGGTGYTGANIAREAVSRGHRVIAVGRSEPKDPIDGVEYRIGDAADADVTGADVVVASLAARGGVTAEDAVELNKQLAAKAEDAGARFVFIGGFMSTRPAAGEPRHAEVADIPDEYAPEVLSGLYTLQWLESEAPEDLNWLSVSPSQEYGAWVAGERTGQYRTSEDISLFDGAGKSYISGADFALAIVDEIGNPTVKRSQIHFAY